MKVREAHIYDVDFPTRKKVNPNALASKVAIHGFSPGLLSSGSRSASSKKRGGVWSDLRASKAGVDRVVYELWINLWILKVYN